MPERNPDVLVIGLSQLTAFSAFSQIVLTFSLLRPKLENIDAREDDILLAKRSIAVIDSRITKLTIAEMICVSVIEDANIPIDTNSAARKKYTITDPHVPTSTTPP